MLNNFFDLYKIFKTSIIYIIEMNSLLNVSSDVYTFNDIGHLMIEKIIWRDDNDKRLKSLLGK